MYSQIQNFYKYAKLISNFKKFWVLQNPDPIIHMKKNVLNLLQHVTWQFNFVYKTTSWWNKILTFFHCWFCFLKGSKTFTRLSNNGIAHCGKKTKGGFDFTETSLKTYISHLMKNCYSTFGNLTMKQWIGIPMRIDFVPFIEIFFSTYL